MPDPEHTTAHAAADEADRFGFWQRWLYVAFLFSALIGVALVVASGSALFGWWNGPIAETFFGEPEFAGGADGYREWISAVLGATIAAWAVLGAAVTRHAFGARERWARDAIVASLVVWAVLDTAMSVRAGVWVNVALNTAFVAMIAPPLIATWSTFGERRPAGGRAEVGGR